MPKVSKEPRWFVQHKLVDADPLDQVFVSLVASFAPQWEYIVQGGLKLTAQKERLQAWGNIRQALRPVFCAILIATWVIPASA